MDKADLISNTHYDKEVDDRRLSLLNGRFNDLTAWVFQNERYLINTQIIILITNYPKTK